MLTVGCKNDQFEGMHTFCDASAVGPRCAAVDRGYRGSADALWAHTVQKTARRGVFAFLRLYERARTRARPSLEKRPLLIDFLQLNPNPYPGILGNRIECGRDLGFRPV
jgi:hypothetical protein